MLEIKKFKIKIFAITLISLLALSIASMALMASAQVGITQPEKTVGYMSVAPTLIGVGQTATVNLWVYPVPVNYYYVASYNGYNGIEVTFVKPDGSKDTFMPVDGTGQFDPGQTESLGSIYFFYEPDMAGNWSVSFTMPAQNITDSTGTVLYQACTSGSAYFTVTEEPQYTGLLNGYPWGPLPDDDVYWSYPINSNNRDWSEISGDWLQGNVGTPPGMICGVTSRLWQPYGTAPETGHIVWASSITSGGLVGGQYGGLSYSQSSLNIINGAVIMEGKVLFNIPNANKIGCIDLTTGELVYEVPGAANTQILSQTLPPLYYGLHLPGNAASQSGLDSSVVLASSHGSNYSPYLFYSSGSTWSYYDVFTGTLIRQLANATGFFSGIMLVDGTNLAYGTRSGNLFAWDMSKVVGNNWPTGITWETPLPTPIIGGAASLFAVASDVSTVVLRTTNEYWGYDAEDGTLLWHITLDYPVVANEAVSLYSVDDFVVFDPVAVNFHCYSLKTGAELWESDSFSDSAWASTWTVYDSETSDYDNFYFMAPDGIIRALSLETGDTVWESTPIVSGEYTNNVVPFVSGMLMMGGNIYAYAGYSIGYQINPIPRQAMLVCVNATTGNITYTLDSGCYPLAAANGYVITLGTYDGKLYCIGKGQTSTSVTIQNDVVANHATVLIKGNVLDQSPAQPGTPAVADSAMSEWMGYLNLQNATLLNNPPQEPGVPVTLTAVDPNGNTITIGTTTTDSAGNYGINFVPENTGMYTVKASFAGTDSYWPSSSETKLSVTSAATVATATPISFDAINNNVTTTIIAGVIAIIVAVAIVGLLVLRKK